MSASVHINYSITSLEPTEPPAGEYVVSIAYTLSCEEVDSLTSDVTTVISSSALYQGVTSDMDSDQRLAQMKRCFELIELPAFEAFANKAKAARDENALIEIAPDFIGGAVTMEAPIAQGTVGPL